MSERIRIRISGPYPKNAISAAINGLGDQADEAVTFEFGELIEDKGFSPDLAATANIAAIIGTVLAAVQLVVTLFRRRRDSADHDSQTKKSDNGLCILTNDALQELPQARDHRIMFSVEETPAGETNVLIVVSSRVRLESVRAQVLVAPPSVQSELTLGPVRRGVP